MLQINKNSLHKQNKAAQNGENLQQKLTRLLGDFTADRIFDAKWTIFTSAIIAIILILSGQLSASIALLCALIISLATIIGPKRHEKLDAALQRGGYQSAKTVSQNRPALPLLQQLTQHEQHIGPNVKAVLEGLPEPAMILCSKQIVRAANKKARQLMPTLRQGEPVSFALRVPEVLDSIATILNGHDGIKVEFTERVPVERYFEAYISPIVTLQTKQEERPHRYIILVLKDFTQQKRLEQMRADFVANASHELRTPLATVSGFIETIQGSARDDAQARDKFLDIMKTQAYRMKRLIDDLLSLSRIELNAHIRPDDELDIVRLIHQVIDTLMGLASERGLDINVTGDAHEIFINGDKDELIRVLENLIENAIKYGSDGDKVDINIELIDTYHGVQEVSISIRDYGQGIAPEHLPRLTERFYRVNVGASREQGGTGLGLAIVKHIVNRHRGRLLIDSEPGKGSTFTIRLDALPDNNKNTNNS